MIFGPYFGVVDQVRDGDTIYCKLDLGFDLTVYAKIRVFGINAPELTSPEGQNALAFAKALLPIGSAVQVVSHGWDKYGGRIDADVFFGDKFNQNFADEMVANGFAVEKTYT